MHSPHATMSTQTVTKKRKSVGETTSATKKVKTAKSADKPAPKKSSLKKSKSDKAVEATVKPSKTVKAKTTKKVDEDADAQETPVKILVEDTPEGGAAELTEDQTAALLAGFSSSDDEASASEREEDEGLPLTKLPQAPRTKEIQTRINAAVAANPEKTPGVIYIGRIPHGFFEHQMRAYLSQFGDILHLRLARNRKTGQSQHYAFVEFASAAVAEIVAKTMDKYLLFGRILQVRVVPAGQVKEGMWGGSGRRKKPAPRNRLEGTRLKRGLVREDWEKKVGRESERRAEKGEKLREMGYEFEMPGVKAVSEVPVRVKRVEGAGVVGEEPEGVELVQDVADEQTPSTEIVRTVQAEPDNITVTETKTTKKRSTSSGKTNKAKKGKA